MYWPYEMHHAVWVHNLLSTIAIMASLSLHLNWTSKNGDNSLLRICGCIVRNRPPTSTIGKIASRVRWGIHLGIIYEYKYHADEQTNTNRVYTKDGHSYATLEDEAAAAIMEQDDVSEFSDIGGDDNDDSDDSPPGPTGGSSKDPAPPPPPEPKSDDDDVQEVFL
ncbi:unnamed protein product [Closterium sp. NIES-54]